MNSYNQYKNENECIMKYASIKLDSKTSYIYIPAYKYNSNFKKVYLLTFVRYTNFIKIPLLNYI